MRQRLEVDFNTPMILDGGTGTELTRRGWTIGSCLESWAIDHTGIVTEVQRGFIEAGAGVLLTCTFGANRFRLGAYGQSDQVAVCNRQLAEVALQSAKTTDTVIAGDIGPTGERYETMADDGFVAVSKAFQEQAEALITSGVDLLFIETMVSLGEAQAALRGCRKAIDILGMSVPIAVCLVFGDDLVTLDQADPEEVFSILSEEGADAVGCNCTPTGEKMIEIIRRFRASGDLPLIAKPSAGLPEVIDGVAHYPVSPEQFANDGLGLRAAGATWVGGCCGASPDHIRALSTALNR
ncbi:MAG TPA: homocysteine S-methyltransferase family protein [candidate division Zixibacteria bacterium]|nr:homocysteine S-methyltransferase family protein [candidate division Zixibacteria bacterium]